MAYQAKKPSSWPGHLSALAVVGALFWIFSRLGNPGTQQPGLAFRAVRVADGLTGQVGPPRTVLIRGNTISRVMDAHKPVPAGYTLVTAPGSTLLPGLVDLGVFLSLEGNLPADSRPIPPEPSLELQRLAGVTTVLDLNSSRPLQRDYRRHQGLYRYPRVLFAGPVFTGEEGWRPPGRTPWETNLVELTSTEEIDAAWRSHVTFAYDLCFVSLEHPGLGHAAVPLEILRDLARRARARGLPLVIHAPTSSKMALALEARPDVILGSPHNEILDLALLQAWAKTSTAWAPALGEILNLWPGRDLRPEWDDYEGVAPLSAMSRRSLTRQRHLESWNRAYDLEGTRREVLLDNVRRAHQAGVRIVAASMAGLPGVVHGRGLHREMDWLVQAGLSPAESLAAATGLAARAVGLKSLGRVRAGTPANLVLVDGDPSTDASAHLRIRAVVVEGAYFPRNLPQDAPSAGTQP